MRRLVFYLVIIVAFLSVFLGVRAITTLFTTYITGSGFVQSVDETRILRADIINANTLQIRVQAISGATQAGVSYTIRVTLDSGVESSALVSWNAGQVAANVSQVIGVGGLTNLLQANTWIIQITR